tara:strand:- start:84379 stop:85611 length:1233 start_codon:yes stop_codon:yes gene_type:complete
MAQPNRKISKSKIQNFKYECKNAKGHKVNGEINAVSTDLARAELRRQGMTPVKVRKVSKPIQLTKKKIASSDISYFSRQLATMMSAGVPLVQSFEIVARGSDNESVTELVLKVKTDIEGGSSFAEALKQHPKYFDPLFCNLVGAGESSGALETMLDRIATYKEKSESIKKKVKKALFYPTAVMVVAMIVTAILLIFVVPQFEELFKGFGADLPVFTQFVIELSEFVQSYWWMISAGMGAAASAFVFFKKRSTTMQHILDRLILKIPLIGDILNKAAIARYARTLATTFAAGVPLVEALDSVAGATGNIVYSQAVMQIKDEVSTGTQVNQAMRNTSVFPSMVIQMVAIGEESGSLDSMLEKVANIYEEEVDAAVDGLSSLLEPLIMAVLGVLVGGLVIAMYLPIFKMGSVI